MIYFKKFLFFLIIPFILVWYTGENEVVNISWFIPMWTVKDDIIEQKAWYNFIIKNFTISTDCKMWNSPCSKAIDFYISDKTNSWTSIKYFYSNFSADETKDLLTVENTLLFKWLLELDNLDNDFWIFYNITGYYERENINIFYKINKEILTSDFNNFVSLILLFWISLYLIYFFAKSWYYLGYNYFNKKRKNEFD